MRPDRLTSNFTQALQEAQSLALGADQQMVEPDHILLAILSQKDGTVNAILEKAGVDSTRLKALLMTGIDQLAKVTQHDGDVQFSRDAVNLLNLCEKEASTRGDEYISSELFLLTSIKSKARIRKHLEACGANEQNIQAAIQSVRGDHRVDSQEETSPSQMLQKYTLDLTKNARDGKLDPVIGRDDEIRRVIQVLQRRTKNNPVLIGEPGVGKTAIVEGLAQRIVSGEVPTTLLNRRLLVLDLALLLAGAKFRGEFEERLQGVLKEVSKDRDEIILFIDEIHTLVGAGKAEGAIDAGNMLKPALARGELHCVGATTLDEYRKNIEKDPALERRFQKVLVDEPSVEDTIAILRGLKGKYEIHHGIQISDPAIIAATEMSQRYVTDRFLPDKAIDLIDEATSRIRIEIDSKPESMDKLDRKIIQLKIEREAVKKESDEASKKRLKGIEDELENLQKEYADLEEIWTAEKGQIEVAKKIKEELDQRRAESDQAKREGNWQRMSELQYGIIPELEKKLSDYQSQKKDTSLLKNSVGEEEVADIVSKMTGIPVSKLMGGERDKLMLIEDKIGERVIGQKTAVERVADAIRRSRSGLSDPNQPMGSFMFLGPTGVGKTELSKALAEFLFNSEDKLIRIDMSEYMEKHSVARLIGAPPGYVGYDEGGYLSEQVRRKPYSIILFDEIEKAHPDVFNVLLQVLDDGRLTDGQGRTVDFKNTVIIMTSNLGSRHIQEDAGKLDERTREKVMAEVHATFRPEFINRVDEIVIFESLSNDQIKGIAELQLKQLQERLRGQDVEMHISSDALDELARIGYDPLFGARPLKRAITRQVENALAKELISGHVGPGDTVNLEVSGGELFIKKS